MPPDLRAALVRALAYTPDARVIEQLDFRGRPAAVINHPSWAPGTIINRYTADPIIDRYTHEYLGSRWELGPADMKSRRNQRLFNSSRVRLVSYRAENRDRRPDGRAALIGHPRLSVHACRQVTGIPIRGWRLARQPATLTSDDEPDVG